MAHLPVLFAFLALSPSHRQGPARSAPPLLLPLLLDPSIELGDGSNAQNGVFDPLKRSRKIDHLD